MARNLSGSPGPSACQERALSAGFVALDVGGGQGWPAAHFAEVGLEALCGLEVGSVRGWGAVSQALNSNPPGMAMGLETPGPQSQRVCVFLETLTHGDDTRWHRPTLPPWVAWEPWRFPTERRALIRVPGLLFPRDRRVQHPVRGGGGDGGLDHLPHP